VARSSTAARLAAYQRSYRELAQRVAEIGFIAAGTITHRHGRGSSVRRASRKRARRQLPQRLRRVEWGGGWRLVGVGGADVPGSLFLAEVDCDGFVGGEGDLG